MARSKYIKDEEQDILRLHHKVMISSYYVLRSLLKIELWNDKYELGEEVGFEVSSSTLSRM